MRRYLFILASLVGCSSNSTTTPDSGTAQSAEVKIDGEFLVVAHTTTKLTATTVNGTDAGYTWTSSDTSVATIAADGTVTGVSPGKVTITATGQTSKAASVFNLVIAADVPYLADWLSSGHADYKGLPFNDWNDATPPGIPTSCARCHSTPGFRDYLGDDGTAAFAVDNVAPTGTVIECKACHNQAAQQLTQVTFPSGVTVDGLGPEARCMTCHQGRESTVSVNKTIADAAAPDDDTVSSKLGFKNIHYFAAGATLEGGKVMGGYQYDGKIYDTRFRHVPNYDTCIGCHDQHTLKIKINECANCHPGVATVADLRNIRMMSSRANDYDGDDDKGTGIAVEIDNIRAKLLTAIQAYVTAKGLDKICYSAEAYPYFFKDTNGDGSCDATEAVSANSYKSWTNRLLRAAYNYQVSLKDPGAFAHNAKYIIQIMHDSLEDVNNALPDAAKIDISAMKRNDPGHFDGSGAPARDWDNQDAVTQVCSQCHSGSTGFNFYQQYGVGILTAEPDDGLDCFTCHAGLGNKAKPDFSLTQVAQVKFPSGIVVKPDDKTKGSSFICMTCHQGRESKATIDAAIAGNRLGFRNVHYLAAGATYYGHEAQVGYEYSGKTYAGRPAAHTGGADCVNCHNPVNTNHTFLPNDNIAYCRLCHGQDLADVADIRMGHSADYDGDGNTSETLDDEIQHLAGRLLAQIQSVAPAPICYNGGAYPYWFKDTNGDKSCDASESVSANGFPSASWTPALMKAAHNFQISQKEPGAWAHNFNYIAELLIDSIADLGGDVSALNRP